MDTGREGNTGERMRAYRSPARLHNDEALQKWESLCSSKKERTLVHHYDSVNRKGGYWNAYCDVQMGASPRGTTVRRGQHPPHESQGLLGHLMFHQREYHIKIPVLKATDSGVGQRVEGTAPGSIKTGRETGKSQFGMPDTNPVSPPPPTEALDVQCFPLLPSWLFHYQRTFRNSYFYWNQVDDHCLSVTCYLAPSYANQMNKGISENLSWKLYWFTMLRVDPWNW